MSKSHVTAVAPKTARTTVATIDAGWRSGRIGIDLEKLDRLFEAFISQLGESLRAFEVQYRPVASALEEAPEGAAAELAEQI